MVYFEAVYQRAIGKRAFIIYLVTERRSNFRWCEIALIPDEGDAYEWVPSLCAALNGACHPSELV